MVKLERELLARLDTDAFYFINFRLFKDGVRSPRTIHLAMEFGNRIIALIVPRNQLFYLLCVPVITDKKCIIGINDDQVINPNQSDMFTRCMHKIVFRGKILSRTKISVTIMRFNIVQSFERSQVTPLGVKRYNSNPF